MFIDSFEFNIQLVVVALRLPACECNPLAASDANTSG